MIDRPPEPWHDWPAELWEQHRAALLVCRKKSSAAWWTNVGRAAVAMADAHLARLAVDA